MRAGFWGIPMPTCWRMLSPMRCWGAPKLSPYREAMRENLAAAMGIAVENVGVKATTTEHLGFEGREEGISATAVCILFRRSDEQRN